MKSQMLGAVVFGVVKYLPIEMCFVYFHTFVCAVAWVVCDECSCMGGFVMGAVAWVVCDGCSCMGGL
jgi:hypothetical protein